MSRASSKLEVGVMVKPVFVEFQQLQKGTQVGMQTHGILGRRWERVRLCVCDRGGVRLGMKVGLAGE